MKRIERELITERQIIGLLAKQLYDQAPNRQPRRADNIITQVKGNFRKIAKNDNEYYSLFMSIGELRDWLKETLFSINDFLFLNLTQNEVDSCDNNDAKMMEIYKKNETKLSFSTAYDKETSESWRNDFIDLDAFFGNLLISIQKDINNNKKEGACMFCLFRKPEHKNSDRCLGCSANPKFKLLKESDNTPKGKYTKNCKHSCKYTYIICCEECSKKEFCSERCTDKSDTCGLVIKK